MVAERLDDVIGGDADVRGAAVDHAEHRRQHAAHGADLAAVGFARRRDGEEVPEQLVRAVDEVNVHAKSQDTVSCGGDSMSTDASSARSRSHRPSSRCSPSWPTTLPAGGRVPVRAQVGRLPRHRLSRRQPTSSSRAATCSRSIATFPSCTTRLLEQLPAGCVLDGEIVIATPRGLDFDALQMRLHPAASRVAKLAKETPASFVAFDLLAVGGRDLRGTPQAERRARLEQLLADVDAADPPDADDARSRRRRGMARALRGRRPRRRDRQAGARHVPAGQARDAQDQARAHRRLRRRRLSLAQGREERARRLAAARSVRRRAAGCTTSA